jgi:hypothetical protein
MDSGAYARNGGERGKSTNEPVSSVSRGRRNGYMLALEDAAVNNRLGIRKRKAEMIAEQGNDPDGSDAYRTAQFWFDGEMYGQHVNTRSPPEVWPTYYG